MQFDRTEIVIRQRTGLELLDLSVRVLSRHFVPLATASALLGIPFLVLDIWLIGWMVSEDAILAAETIYDAELTTASRYASNVIALYFIQFPLVSLPATMVLGALVFYEPVSVRTLLRMLRHVATPAIIVLGITRLGLVAAIFAYFIDTFSTWPSVPEAWILFACVAWAMIIRGFWPFAPEIIGLERCPILVRSSDEGKISYRKRSRFLHSPIQGEMLVRFFAAALHSAFLLMMLVGTAVFVQWVITGSGQLSWTICYVAFPLSVWLVGVFMTIYRYLSYIDSRIRLEGWELHLRMSAEAARIQAEDEPVIVGDDVLEGSLQT